MIIENEKPPRFNVKHSSRCNEHPLKVHLDKKLKVNGPSSNVTGLNEILLIEHVWYLVETQQGPSRAVQTVETLLNTNSLIVKLWIDIRF